MRFHSRFEAFCCHALVTWNYYSTSKLSFHSLCIQWQNVRFSGICSVYMFSFDLNCFHFWAYSVLVYDQFYYKHNTSLVLLWKMYFQLLLFFRSNSKLMRSFHFLQIVSDFAKLSHGNKYFVFFDKSFSRMAINISVPTVPLQFAASCAESLLLG